MKKTILNFGLLTAAMLYGSSGSAQSMSILPDAILPSITGVGVGEPVNAGSSTLQGVNFGGSTNHLYVHSWDNSQTLDGHIAWRRASSTGATLNQGFLDIAYANDIDVAIYQSGENYYVLAGFYYNSPTIGMKGHYYNIYLFTAGGLVPYSMMNLLGSSIAFGHINVDVNTLPPHRLAIIWRNPSGIYVTDAVVPGPFASPLLLPGTLDYSAPDVSIGHSPLGLKLQMVYRANTGTQLVSKSIDFSLAISSLLTESLFPSAPGYTFGIPRIDCPDTLSSAYKWAYTYSESKKDSVGIGISSVTELIKTRSKNTAFSSLDMTTLVHSSVYTTSNGNYGDYNPVITYNNRKAQRITVGWMTHASTTIIPGTANAKYVAQEVRDSLGTAPLSVDTTYMMISNTPALDYFSILAFSSQNIASNFNGIHTAFCFKSTAPDGIYYKDKPWTSATFKTADETGSMITEHNNVSTYPNPFINTLSIVASEKGQYTVQLYSLEGKLVYNKELSLQAGEKCNINTELLIRGMYLLKVVSAENNIDYLQKVLK